jgi:hypothetical protein
MTNAENQFPKITISTINCNSLNMSSIGNLNHLLKIYGITSLKTDIVLLSDIRMCNTAGVSNLKVPKCEIVDRSDFHDF